MRLKPVRTIYQDVALSLLQEMRYDVLRIGVNVKQAAKRINSATDNKDLQHEVNSIANEMSRFYAQIQAVMASIIQGDQPEELGQTMHPTPL